MKFPADVFGGDGNSVPDLRIFRSFLFNMIEFPFIPASCLGVLGGNLLSSALDIPDISPGGGEG